MAGIMRFSVIGTFLVVVLPTLAQVPTVVPDGNARVAGLGGMGIAVASQELASPMQINPATVALVRHQLQLTLTGSLVSVALGVESEDLLGLRAEVYWPVSTATLFASLAHFSSESASTTLPGFGGAASFSHQRWNVGGELRLWRDRTEITLEGIEVADLTLGGLILSGGLLYKAAPGIHLATTYNTASDDSARLDNPFFDITIAGGIPSTFRLGAALQPEASPWILGAELGLIQDLDTDVGTLKGATKIGGYSEYRPSGQIMARGALAVIQGEGSDALQLSVGASYAAGGGLVLDAFFQWLSSEGVDVTALGVGGSYRL